MAQGKLILITGVTRGLGRALAEEFIALGHTVVGCGRSFTEVKKLKQKFSEPHDFYPVDVANDEAVKSWASVVLTSHGAPDLLLNNAGVINRNAALWEVEAREFNEVVGVNLIGTANVIRHFGAAMVRVNDAMGDAADRRAWFVSALCLAWPDGHTEVFEGRVDGVCVWPPRGTAGFGYDPMFLAVGETGTYGEIPSARKQATSHRARAFALLMAACFG